MPNIEEYINSAGRTVRIVRYTPEELQENTEAELRRVKQTEAVQAISELEESITPRRLREAVLGTDNGWLACTNELITNLRSQIN